MAVDRPSTTEENLHEPGSGLQSETDPRSTDPVAAFRERIEDRRREGIYARELEGKIPWEGVAEAAKLTAIVWESWMVSHGAGVPGEAALETIEREVDYKGLPEVQRDMLNDLRAMVDAGYFDAPRPDHKDLAALLLARISGVGEFERSLTLWKESDPKNWAEQPEASKVSVMVGLAHEAGPPGAYTLEAIEREVDAARLPSWRREAMEVLHSRLNAGELYGENPNPLYQDDRANLALRLTELEARVEDSKRLGVSDPGGQRWDWRELSDEQKLDRIVWEIRELSLESESAVYGIIDREVDMTRVPEWQLQSIEDKRQESWPRPAANDRAGSLGEVDDTGGLDGVTTMDELSTLFREWEEDYAARQHEDRRERDGVARVSEPRESWPSEIVKSHREQQREQGRGNNAGEAQNHGKDDGFSM